MKTNTNIVFVFSTFQHIWPCGRLTPNAKIMMDSQVEGQTPKSSATATTTTSTDSYHPYYYSSQVNMILNVV